MDYKEFELEFFENLNKKNKKCIKLIDENKKINPSAFRRRWKSKNN